MVARKKKEKKKDSRGSYFLASSPIPARENIKITNRYSKKENEKVEASFFCII